MRAPRLGMYLFIPVAVFLSIFPILWMISISLRQPAEAFSLSLDVGSWTLANYISVLGQFRVYFTNSLLVAGGSTLLSMALAIFAAYGFSRFQFRGKRTFLAMLLVNRMFPPVLLALGFFTIVRTLSLYDSLWAVILMDALYTLPFATWMMASYFDSIPSEIDQAGMIDGCSRLGTLVRLVLPVSMPGLVATLVYCFLLSWNEYLYAVTFTLSNENKVVTVALAELIGEWWTNYPQLMALSVLISIPLMLLFVSVQRYLVQGLASHAVKG